MQYGILLEVLRQEVETDVCTKLSRVALLNRPHESVGVSRFVRAETEDPFGDRCAAVAVASVIDKRSIQRTLFCSSLKRDRQELIPGDGRQGQFCGPAEDQLIMSAIRPSGRQVQPFPPCGRDGVG